MSALKKPTLTTRQRAAIIRAASRASVQQRDRLIREIEAEVQQLYAEAAQTIVEHIQQAGNDDGRVELAQLQAVLQYVNLQLSQMSRKRDGKLMDAIARSAALGSSAFGGVLQADRLAHANQSAVAFVRGFVEEDGLQLSDRLWRLDRGAKEALADHIQHAVIYGESAFEAMRRSMGRGEGVPDDIARAVNAAKVGKLGPSVRALMTGAPDPRNGKGVVYQAQRVFNSELMRAHGEAYMAAGFDTDGVVGVRFNLSPNHKKVDVCDHHATADLYNMGAGVYPSRDACPWPAHPNTWSYVTVVFDYEVEAHKAKKNRIIQPSDLPIDPDIPTLPSNIEKSKEFLHVPELPLKRYGLDELVDMGRSVSNQLLADNDDAGFLARFHKALSAHREVGETAQIKGKNISSETTKYASQIFPSSWVRAGHKLPLRAGYVPKTGNYRGAYQYRSERLATLRARSFSSAVHEYTHHLQHTVPGLDDIFQELHGRRTKGERRVTLTRFNASYDWREAARRDHYVIPYQGKEYKAKYGYKNLGRYGAMEVMTIAFQYSLSGDPRLLRSLLDADREMFDLTMGALFYYEP
ncbi:MAG: hypothetical protein WAS93_03515 [Burkholderiaceae bacterium]